MPAMPSTYNLLRYAVATMLPAGLVLLAVGLGAIAPPAPEMEAWVPFWSKLLGFDVPSGPFFAAAGLYKLVGLAGLFDILPLPSPVPQLILVAGISCATVQHYGLGEPLIPPLVYLVLTLALIFVSKPKSSKKQS